MSFGDMADMADMLKMLAAMLTLKVMSGIDVSGGGFAGLIRLGPRDPDADAESDGGGSVSDVRFGQLDAGSGPAGGGGSGGGSLLGNILQGVGKAVVDLVKFGSWLANRVVSDLKTAWKYTCKAINFGDKVLNNAYGMVTGVLGFTIAAGGLLLAGAPVGVALGVAFIVGWTFKLMGGIVDVLTGGHMDRFIRNAYGPSGMALLKGAEYAWNIAGTWGVGAATRLTRTIRNPNVFFKYSNLIKEGGYDDFARGGFKMFFDSKHRFPGSFDDVSSGWMGKIIIGGDKLPALLFVKEGFVNGKYGQYEWIFQWYQRWLYCNHRSFRNLRRIE